MLILFGIKLNDSKKVEFALTQIYGIGRSRAQNLCTFLSIPHTLRVSDLTEIQKTSISAYIKQNFTVEAKLRHQIFDNIETLKSINSIRGFRHRSNLPVRGQRTHSNAKTCRRVKLILTK